MNAHSPTLLHINEREEHARRLGLSVRQFDLLVKSANHAYDVIRDLGPFYGREEVKDPTFRITAKPVSLPAGSKEQLTTFGNDLIYVAKALQSLPQNYKDDLGDDLDYKIPPTWRIDAILNAKNQLMVNEVEGVDSANALMMAEQLAYDLQPLNESTAAKLIPTFKAMSEPNKDGIYKLAFIRVLVPYNPHTVNHARLIKFLDILSKGQIKAELLDESSLRSGLEMPDWKTFSGVINHTSLSPKELKSMGITDKQLLAAGNYSALVNKGVFALLFDEALEAFWNEHIGADRLERLRHMLIPSSFIRTDADLQHAQKQGKVVKVSWAGKNTHLINRSKGVAMPDDSIEQGSQERWDLLQQLLLQGVKLIAQDFVEPAQIPTLLRKKGTTLEMVEWYNRVCVKYVAQGNPNGPTVEGVSLTATEVTLGPDVIPAGRKCAFTAGILE